MIPIKKSVYIFVKKIDKVEREIKEKLERSARNARRRCRSGTPGNARGAPTEHFQQKYIYI